MANSETGTSPNNVLGGEYQVFLSFRGPDTRCSITDVLHHALVDVGIRVFIDNEELRKGERISGNILRAIDHSKLYIPIFSKNYASSYWCLSELAKMVKNTSQSKENGKDKAILPIFYKVKPDDVKLKTPLYREAISNLKQKMENHEKKFSSEDLNTWQQALIEVGGITGWELEKYPGYAKLVQAVVEEAVVRLEIKQRDVTKDLVGMEARIAEIKKLLEIDSGGGVHLIGIYGMGGSGKTTLAKIMFNQLCPRFGRSCIFLDDVREIAKTKGLVELQKKLWLGISHSRVVFNIANIDEGINKIEETICNNKMLIVLDDVDKADQIQKLIGKKSLCPGTIIFVTTRDKSVLNIREFKYKFEDYEMEPLSKEDALKLFSKHVFNDYSPPVAYSTLSKGIASTTGGLPLALEAIGSLLFGEEERDIWEEWLEKLKKTPHEDVLGKLKISYDALHPDQRQIFLDIACFFIGENKTNPMYMWKECGLFPASAIKVLIKRCMIKVLDNDIFEMHDQFRELGRAIARKECTRLWDKHDIFRELRSTKIKESVQALSLRMTFESPTIITAEQLRRFPHLKFLWLSDVVCEGDFTGCLFELKSIILSGNSMNFRKNWPTNLGAENVVVMNIIRYNLNKDEISYLIKGATELKVLTLKNNYCIRETPAFLQDSVLEKLTFWVCPSLKEIDSTVGKLSLLTDLSFDSCEYLEKLPEEIGELQNLRHLSLRKCLSLSELPGSFSKLELLMKLDISYTRITRLPYAIGRLRSLSSANVSYTPITKLPSTMSKLLCLKTLNLEHDHRIKEWPELPISLTNLRLRSNSLLTVPNLSNLTNLVELLLADRSGEYWYSIPIQIPTGDLRWIGTVSKLSKLYLSLLNVRAPTTELGSLSLLKEITLSGLDFRTLMQLPSNLIVLKLYRLRVKCVHLSGLPPLEKSRENEVYEQLDGQSRNELQASELIEPWRGNFLVLSPQKMLREFHMAWGREVEVIDFFSPLESLEVFTVKDCESLRRIKALSNLKNLKRLHIENCDHQLYTEGIHELEFLQLLKVRGNISFKEIFDASSSKIPNKCRMDIEFDCRSKCKTATYYGNWESFREEFQDDEEEVWEFSESSDSSD